MKRHMVPLSLLFSSVALVGVIGCEREAPTAKDETQSDPAAPRGQANLPTFDGVVKTPLDKAREVENMLEKGAERTADTVNGATHDR